jgi:hypothetical protein
MLFVAFLILTPILFAMTLLESRLAFMKSYPLILILTAFCLLAIILLLVIQTFVTPMFPTDAVLELCEHWEPKWPAPYIPASTIKANDNTNSILSSILSEAQNRNIHPATSVSLVSFTPRA